MSRVGLSRFDRVHNLTQNPALGDVCLVFAQRSALSSVKSRAPWYCWLYDIWSYISCGHRPGTVGVGSPYKLEVFVVVQEYNIHFIPWYVPESNQGDDTSCGSEEYQERFDDVDPVDTLSRGACSDCPDQAVCHRQLDKDLFRGKQDTVTDGALHPSVRRVD
ncbi:hypothetical protein KCU61_g613, partial [Aureobasidium melanogenum]